MYGNQYNIKSYRSESQKLKVYLPGEKRIMQM